MSRLVMATECLSHSHFRHFFPFPMIKSQCQWLKFHFPRTKTGQSQFPFYSFTTLSKGNVFATGLMVNSVIYVLNRFSSSLEIFNVEFLDQFGRIVWIDIKSYSILAGVSFLSLFFTIKIWLLLTYLSSLAFRLSWVALLSIFFNVADPVCTTEVQCWSSKVFG